LIDFLKVPACFFPGLAAAGRRPRRIFSALAVQINWRLWQKRLDLCGLVPQLLSAAAPLDPFHHWPSLACSGALLSSDLEGDWTLPVDLSSGQEDPSPC